VVPLGSLRCIKPREEGTTNIGTTEQLALR
jgi:hypothetical protein